MKKLFCLLALGMALVACEEAPVEEVDPNTRTVTFCAGFDQTRTILIDKTFYWDFDDVIGGFATEGNTNVQFTTVEDRNGWFEGTVKGTTNEFLLYYPYREGTTIAGSVITTTLPETQKLVAGSTHDVFPMVATTNNIESKDPIKFYNTCGVVRFAVKSNIARTITSLTFTAADQTAAVTGTGKIDMSNIETAAMVMQSSGSKNSVTLEGSVEIKAEEVTYFYVVLPPATYKGGFDVTLTDAAGKSTTADAAFFGAKDLTLARNKMINVSKVIEFNSTGSVELTSVNASNPTIAFDRDAQYDTLFVASKTGFANVKAAKLTLRYTSMAEGVEVEPTIKINGEEYSADKTYDITMPVTIELTCADVTKQYTVKLSQLTDTGLPVVYVYTPSEITSKDDWTEGCYFYIDANGRASWDGSVSFEDFNTMECEVKGRGNTTWKFNKKPYAIKLSKKSKVLGMPKHKRWVLLANAIDMSMMRNSIGFEIAKIVYNRNGVANSQGNVWTPRGHSVELVFNGEHKGNYLLCEQIKIDENRVNIAEADDPVNATSDQGYLIEADRLWGSDDTEQLWWCSYRKNTIYGVEPYNNSTTYYHMCYTTYTPESGNTDALLQGVNYGFKFGLKSPDDGDLGENGAGKTTPAFQWINVRFNEVETLIFDHRAGGPYAWDGDTYYNEVAKYIDMNSFIDYFIINEVVMNHELNNPGSVYMYYNPTDQKIYAGPIWDLDWTTFKDAKGRYNEVNGNKYKTFLVANTIWYCRLTMNTKFVQELKARWAEVKPYLLAFAPSVTTMKNYLTKSAEYNWNMWTVGTDTNGQNPNGLTNSDGTAGDPDFATAANYIETNITQRVNDLDQLINNHVNCFDPNCTLRP